VNATDKCPLSAADKCHPKFAIERSVGGHDLGSVQGLMLASGSRKSPDNVVLGVVFACLCSVFVADAGDRLKHRTSLTLRNAVCYIPSFNFRR
jgi:hypothetical protein